MARLIGIDIRTEFVRALVLRASYRRLALERVAEVDIVQAGGVQQAVAAAVGAVSANGEPIALALEGERCFLHRLTLPPTAARQVEEILPFELEAQVPIEFSQVVYDYRVLTRRPEEPLVALAAVAREAHVRELITLTKSALGSEPERISAGALPLGNLVELYPEQLHTADSVAVVEMGGNRTEVVVLRQGELVFGRTMSRGTRDLAQEGGAELLAAELRQSLMAWLAQGGDAISRVWLVGAPVAGAEQYLEYHLGAPVAPLPLPQLEDITDEQRPMLSSFAKALSLALGLRPRPKDLDLRRGALAYQRGFGFLKEKIPTLAGLAATVFVFFIFSTWAEMRTLERDRVVLEGALEKLSKQVLGDATTDPDRVEELLGKGPKKEDDPMPYMDAFDVVVEISKAVPMAVTHDIQEFDMQKGGVKLNGVVGSTDEAQNIAAKLKEHRCFHNVKLVKISQVVNSDRQKYVLELDVMCPEDAGYDQKKSGAKEKSK